MTFTAGQKLRASELNATIDRPRVLVVANSTTTYSTAFVPTVFSNPGSTNDPFGMWNSAQPTRLTCTADAVGLWMFQPVVTYVSSTSTHFGELRLNGVTIAGSGASSAAPASIQHVMPLPITFLRLAAGDYLELFGYANPATASGLSAGQVPKLDGVRIGV